MDAPNPLDQAAPVRQGEALDLAALEAYSHSQFPELGSAALEVLQFPSGHSNLTYLLRLGQRELVLRRPPFGVKIKSAHDMQREYQILAHLAPLYPRVPHPLAYCADETVIGAPFYLMERLKGIILRGARPPGLDLSPLRMQALSENFVNNLVEIHRVDYQTAGLADLGHPQGYIRRQIEGWTQRYTNSRTDDVPDMLRSAAWLAGHLPVESGAALIHNDYKYDNLMLNPLDWQIIGVLDWEMATIGDPLMDLGTSLGYWTDPDDPPDVQALSFGLTSLPGNLNRRQIAERYARQSGRDLGDICFYYVYGLFKITVIIQQIYARYKAGFTTDERFARLGAVVRILARTAGRAIENGRIDGL